MGPEPSFLERADVGLALIRHMIRPHLQATREVIAPLGDCWPESDIFPALTERMGLPHPLPFVLPPAAQNAGMSQSHETLVDMLVRLSDLGDHYGEQPEGLTVDRLLTEFPHGYTIPDHDFPKDTELKVLHPSGKIELWE